MVVRGFVLHFKKLALFAEFINQINVVFILVIAIELGDVGMVQATLKFDFCDEEITKVITFYDIFVNDL